MHSRLCPSRDVQTDSLYTSRAKGMDESAEWAENYIQQVEETVALQAILGDDFSVQLDGRPQDPDQLLQQAEVAQLQGLPQGPVCFHVCVRLTIPERGLTLQVGEGNATGHIVKHLPPVRLHLVLPHGYPSAATPEFSLAAPWLSASQTKSLTSELEAMAAAEQGLSMGFSMISWLQESALDHLKIKDTLIIHAARDSIEGDLEQQRQASSIGCTTSASSDSDNTIALAHGLGLDELQPDELTAMLVQFDASRELQLFQEGTYTCLICFEDVPGTQCIRAASCQHFYCCRCLQSHCQTQLNENRIDMLLCPDPKCTEPLHRDRVASLLTPEEVQRWEDTELQTTLLKMKDVVFCPRCSTATIEDGDNSALCSKCHFAFCSLCQSAYHPGQRCMSVEMKLKMLKERLAGRKDGELLRELKRKEEELLSVASIQKMSKPCPVCSAAISKSEGCNKMTCIYCGTLFCWLCNKVVSGYDHFGAEGCQLFDEEEIRRWNEMWGPFHRPDRAVPAGQEAVRAGQQGFRAKPCSQCGQLNTKRGNLNLITCWACRCRYCYICGKTLRKGEGATHFRPTTGCPQHSPD